LSAKDAKNAKRAKYQGVDVLLALLSFAFFAFFASFASFAEKAFFQILALCLVRVLVASVGALVRASNLWERVYPATALAE